MCFGAHGACDQCIYWVTAEVEQTPDKRGFEVIPGLADPAAREAILQVVEAMYVNSYELRKRGELAVDMSKGFRVTFFFKVPPGVTLEGASVGYPCFEALGSALIRCPAPVDRAFTSEVRPIAIRMCQSSVIACCL
jgi:hypothetical protein